MAQASASDEKATADIHDMTFDQLKAAFHRIQDQCVSGDRSEEWRMLAMRARLDMFCESTGKGKRTGKCKKPILRR